MIPVIHVTVGRVFGESSNGVLAVVRELFAEQQKTGPCSLISIVRTPSSSARQGYFEFRMGLELLRFVRGVAKRGPTLFHLHGGLNYQLHALALLLRALGITYVVSPHGAFAERQSMHRLSKTIYTYLVVRPFLLAAKFVQVYGEDDAALIGALPTKLVRIPNGVRAASRIQVRRRLDSTLRLGYCGRLHREQKGIELFRPVLLELRRREIELTFHVIGTGPDHEWLVRDLKIGELGHVVVFHGEKFGTERDSILSSIDVFLHPSFFEGMPLAPLEALSLGCKLVVSNATNLGAYIGELPIVRVLASRDPVQWADAIQAVYHSNVELADLNLLLQNQLSWGSIAGQFRAEYER